MLEKTLLQRLQRKAQQLQMSWEKNGKDWDETAYQLFAQNMGFKVNSEPFAQLSRSLPLKTIWKNTDQLTTLEALLLGQAGFLQGEMPDEYSRFLQREYNFYAYKYQLLPLEVQQWKFSKLRPANFPTVRLAQWAALLQRRKPSFESLLGYEQLDYFYEQLDIQPSDYWQQHYHLGKPSQRKIGSLGKKSVENLVINTIVPLMVLWGQVHDAPSYLEKALRLLEQIKPEDNHIIELYENLGFQCQNAYDSQALLELHTSFCQPKNCLQCDIGIQILKKTKPSDSTQKSKT